MDFESIDQLMFYSRRIIGKSLNDIIAENEYFSDKHTMSTTKGILGNLVETEFYHYPNNNEAKADFENLGVELKTTGMIKTKNGIRAKERLVLSMINYMDIVNETFDNSHLMDKNNLILILWYCYQKDVDFKDFKFVTLLLYSLERDRDVIENDFNIIKNKVLQGKAHEISEGDTTYLGACTKGKNSKETRIQPYSDIPARSRAFCLKNNYMTLLLNEIMTGTQVSKPNKSRYLSVIDYINDKLTPYFGKTQLEIADEIGLTFDKNKTPKNLNKLISDRIIGKDKDLKELDEIFKYSNYVIKNSPLIKGWGFKERMFFKNMSLSDFEVDWDDSNWKHYFEDVCIINILYEFDKAGSKLGEGILKEVKTITFSADDIDSMEITFNMIKNAITCYRKKELGHDIERYVNILPTPKSFENQILEIGPRASKGKNSYYTLFENDKDRTNVAFALNKEFLNKKLELY